MLPPIDTSARATRPPLSGLVLRPLQAEEFEALFAVASDPLIWEQHPDRERHTEERFRIFFREALESGGALIALDARDGRVLGSSRYQLRAAAPDEVEIGWTFLARSHWGGRHNGEMKRLMLEHAFRFVERVVFLIGPENIRSQRAVEKIGGVRAEPRLGMDGKEKVVYAIAAEAWRAVPRP